MGQDSTNTICLVTRPVIQSFVSDLGAAAWPLLFFIGCYLGPAFVS